MTEPQPTPERGWRRHLDVLATLLVIVTCGALLWNAFRPVPVAPSRPEPALPEEPVSLDGAAMHGSSAASAVMLVFSEFECPFCATYAKDTAPTIQREYVETGRLLVAHRHFPLEQIHSNAVAAGVAAECALRAGRFWDMHDAVFALPRPLDPRALPVAARTIGLEMPDYQECTSAADAEAKVRADMAEGQRLGVSGTPTFFFGRRLADGTVAIESRLTGARPVEEFRSRIDVLLVVGTSS